MRKSGSLRFFISLKHFAIKNSTNILFLLNCLHQTVPKTYINPDYFNQKKYFRSSRWAGSYPYVANDIFVYTFDLQSLNQNGVQLHSHTNPSRITHGYKPVIAAGGLSLFGSDAQHRNSKMSVAKFLKEEGAADVGNNEAQRLERYFLNNKI